MALGTYAELKTSIATWLFRAGETQTEAYIPDMIRMAEAEFNRVLRVDDMTFVSTSLAVTDGVADLPVGTRSLHSVRETGSEHYQIKPKPIDEIERYEDLNTGFYQFYARYGGQLHFWPRKTGAVRLRGLQEIPALSDSNTTNWLLQKHPDLYLHQSLACGEAFNMNDTRIAIWKAMAGAAIDQINDEDAMFHKDGLAPTVNTGVAV